MSRLARRLITFLMFDLTPRSLRGQFTLGLLILFVFMIAGGLAAIYAVRTASQAIQQLAQTRLGQMQNAQEVVERTLEIQSESERLLFTASLLTVRASYTAILQKTEALEQSVARLADADDMGILDLLQTNQLYRNTANVVAQMRENEIQSELAFARGLAGAAALTEAWQPEKVTETLVALYRLYHADSVTQVDALRSQFDRAALPQARPANDLSQNPFSARMALIEQRQALAVVHAHLLRQSNALVSAARTRSAFFDNAYLGALRDVVAAAKRKERQVIVLLAGSLLFTWLIAHFLLGQRVLGRLRSVSLYLQAGTRGPALGTLLDGRDEIAAMGRAVDRFMLDRTQLQLRTAELSSTKDHLVEQGHVLEMIAESKPLVHILDRLVRLIESQLIGIKCSIFLLDGDGLHLRLGASPNLPATYNQAFECIRVGPTAGSCGTAVMRRAAVVVADIQSDALWADHRDLATAHGLRSCWSAPIFSHQAAVLGTFAMYSQTVRVPSEPEIRLVELATRIAGIAIERRRAEQHIRHLVNHDELTGLANRTLLKSRMTRAVTRAQVTGKAFSVLFVDLDGFKYINDSFGHSVGDEALIAVSNRLERAVGRRDVVARTGGDEFVVMLRTTSDAQAAIQIAQQLLRVIADPVALGSRTVVLGASVGIGIYPEAGEDSETMLRNADIALYTAKQKGRGCCERYSAEMGRSAHLRTQLRMDLTQALDGQQFQLHYQPQMNLRTERIDSLEALIRWQHPDFGLVSPAEFIPLAEESGAIVAIGEWVLRTACAQLAQWRTAGHLNLSVAVNLSPVQFQGHDVATMVSAILATCAVPAEFLELELTETALMADAGAILDTLLRVKGQGVRLALDDFGTGHSSLSHLRRFPIDVIKIDRSFTAEVTKDGNSAAIAHAILVMAKALGLKTVAEGVETQEQLDFMVKHGCDSVQGYYYSRPLAVAEMSAMLSGTPPLVGATGRAGSD